jgi:hypothetical protein
MCVKIFYCLHTTSKDIFLKIMEAFWRDLGKSAFSVQLAQKLLSYE